MTIEERTRVLEEPTPDVRTDPGLPPFLESELEKCGGHYDFRIDPELLPQLLIPAQAADHPKFGSNLSKADYEAKIRLLEEEVETLHSLLWKRKSEMRALSGQLVEARSQGDWGEVTYVASQLDPK